MNAEIVSVGTEILLGQIVDTNAQAVGLLLAELGIGHTHRQTVGDNLGRLTEALRLALSRSDIVFTIGGLGPTEDDLTRDGIAAALDDPLVVDETLEERLKAMFAQRKLAWVDSQLRQATRPSCAEPIDNPNGTAPGLVCRKGGKTVFALPGPKNEFVPMLRGPVREELVRLAGGRVIHSRIVRVCGLGEALVEEKIRHLLSSEDPTVAPYAKPGEVHLRVTSRASSVEEAEARIGPMVNRICDALGHAVFGYDETTLEAAVLECLRIGGRTLAVAESCTGGGLGERLTSVAGASSVFLGGFVTYSNEAKASLLGVSVSTLKEEGAVSAKCAEEMAIGAKARLAADYGVSITGIAGPNGGTAEKPVGLVYVAVAGPDGCVVEEHRFRGIREDIRRRATQAALVLLRSRAMAT